MPCFGQSVPLSQTAAKESAQSRSQDVDANHLAGMFATQGRGGREEKGVREGGREGEKGAAGLVVCAGGRAGGQGDARQP